MGQIHGPSLGSPAAIVTGKGELLITGSVGTTNTLSDSDSQFGRNIQQDILTELKILNTHMELINNEKINEEDIRR